MKDKMPSPSIPEAGPREPMQPRAKVIADSISESGVRLTTMEVVMHRFILAEMNTHRVFSRNSSSSRAIPYEKIRDRVQAGPAFPVHWGAEQKGMQSGDSLDETNTSVCRLDWTIAMRNAVAVTNRLAETGLHKSLCNRLLEPFMWHTAIISATDWDNFFFQRCDPAAQPEMKAVADEMQRAYYRSTPKKLSYGEWHTPYIDSSDLAAIREYLPITSDLAIRTTAIAVSVARCARVSYLTHDGKRDIEKDLELFEKLKTSGHWSPFEHVATPVKVAPRSNFRGWKQYRKEFANENRTGFVPNLPDLKDVADEMERQRKEALGQAAFEAMNESELTR